MNIYFIIVMRKDMDWIKQLNRIMVYVDDNLQAEISNDRISEIACCSIYNFQSMFSYIAQTLLSEYIQSRRLTLAVFDILKGNEKIIDIALKYGYDSQDAFSHAFRTFHGGLPSAVKKESVMVKSCPKLSFQITVKGVNKMNYQIVGWHLKFSEFRRGRFKWYIIKLLSDVLC